MGNRTFDVIDANTVFGFWPRMHADISLERLARLMEKWEVQKALTLSAQGIFSNYLDGNKETHATCSKFPQLIPVATINPLRYFGCIDEVKRQIDLGVKVFRFFPEYQEWTPDDPCFCRLLDRTLAASGVALMMSAQVGIGALERLASRVDGPVIMEGPAGVQNGNLIVMMQDHPNFFIESHRMCTVDWVEVLAREAGSDQILYGSYAPLKFMSAAMDQVTNAPATDEVKQKILSGNIQRILGVDL